MKIHRLAASLVLCFVLLVHNSCNEDVINVEPFGLTEASYFTEEIDFERTIYGVYAKLTDLYWFNNNEPPHPFFLLPGDDLTHQGNFAFENFANLEAATGTVGYMYSRLYQLINRANTALQVIDTRSEGIYVTPNLREYNRGEALFLRGLMYHKLWTYFGTSPLIIERIQELDQTRQPSTTGTQLLDQAIADFQAAAALLPPAWSENNRGRATANSANGMLGKALVTRASVTGNAQDYTAAITAFNAIAGVSLVADFGDNFAADAENNAESLFEHQASRAPGENVWLPNDFDTPIGSRSAYWAFFDPDHFTLWAVGGQPIRATQKLINAFEPGDPRLTQTLDPATGLINKYVSRDELSPEGVGSLNNPRILRYADVLLLRAEALVESGGSTQEAIQLINQVRTRARQMNPGGTVPANYDEGTADRAQIMQWIMNERFLELAGEEGHRWADLRRWHLGGKIDLANWDFSSVNTAFDFNVNRHLYYPIPLNELDLNPNVSQNPNY